MDSNLLTISNILTQPNVPSPGTVKTDTKIEESRFFIETEHEPAKLGNIQKETADNKVEIKPLRNETKSNGKIEDSQKTQIKQNDSEAEEKEFFDPNQDDSLTSPEKKETLGPLVREVARNLEPQGGRQLAEFIAGIKANRILPVTAKVVKSAENKQLLLTDKGNNGVKTVLPEKSKAQNGLKADLTEPLKEANVKTSEKVQNTAKISVQNQSIGAKKTLSDDGNETKLGSDVFDSHRKNTGTRQDTKDRQIGTLNIKSAFPKGEVNGVSKAAVADVKEGLSETNSVKSTGKVFETSPEIDENVKKTQFNNKTSSPRRFEESAKINGSMQKAKNLTNESNGHKLNINIDLNKQRTGGKSNTGKNFDSNANRIYSHNNSQISAIEQTMNSAENTRAGNVARQSSLSEVSADIGKQILESIHNSLSQNGGDKQITVRLNPPELGTVFIKFQEQDTDIIGLLEVSRTQTRAEIEQALPQIIRNLSDNGINIKRLEVMLTSDEQTEQETLNDNSLFNSQQQQQQNLNNPQLYERGRGVASIYEWLAENINPVNNAGLQHALAIDSSINILM